MAPLPRPISDASHVINGAISEGRAEEAMHKLIHALRTGEDRACRLLAADWIEAIGLPAGSAKALRKGRPALREDWLKIAEMVTDLQSQGLTYARATAQTAVHFGCGERHVESCVADWRKAEEIARETK